MVSKNIWKCEEVDMMYEVKKRADYKGDNFGNI